MGFLEDLFGGGQTSSTSVSTPINMNPFTAALQGPLTNQLTGLLGTGINQYNPTTQNVSQYSAPIGANEQAALGNLQTAAGGPNNRSNYINSVLQGNYLPGSPGGNPFLSAAITAAQRSTAQNLQDTLSRSLPGQFLAAGHNVNPTNGSSAFDTAAALYASRSAQSMADIATNMSNANYQAERQNQQQAVGLGQQEVQTAINNLQAQALPRLIQQYGIDQGLQEYQSRTNQLLQLLATAGGIAQPVIGTQTQSSSTGTTEKGIIPGLFGGKGPYGT